MFSASVSSVLKKYPSTVNLEHFCRFSSRSFASPRKWERDHRSGKSDRHDSSANPPFKNSPRSFQQPNRNKFQDYDPNHLAKISRKDHGNIPNLLTWEQKLQLRELYRGNPEQWTFERLAGCFPASVSTVKKLIKRSKWEPDDVTQHDQAAEKHWRQFLKGEFIVEDYMQIHLMKFAPKHLHTPEKTESRVPKMAQSYAQVQLVDEAEKSQQPKSSSREKLPMKYEQPNSKLLKERLAQTYQIKQSPESIHIPEKKWVEGATYKMGDSYYHSDGTFLYRVPGMK